MPEAWHVAAACAGRDLDGMVDRVTGGGPGRVGARRVDCVAPPSRSPMQLRRRPVVRGAHRRTGCRSRGLPADADRRDRPACSTVERRGQPTASRRRPRLRRRTLGDLAQRVVATRSTAASQRPRLSSPLDERATPRPRRSVPERQPSTDSTRSSRRRPRGRSACECHDDGAAYGPSCERRRRTPASPPRRTRVALRCTRRTPHADRAPRRLPGDRGRPWRRGGGGEGRRRRTSAAVSRARRRAGT